MDTHTSQQTEYPEKFTARVQVAGNNPYVDVPEKLAKKLGGGRKMPVLVMVINPSTKGDASVLTKDAERLRAISRLDEKGWFRTTLISMRTKPTRLYLDRWMRASSDSGVGNEVQIILKPDLSPRELDMPLVLGEALAENEQAANAWMDLPPPAEGR